MILSDMELFQADLERAMAKRQEAKKAWVGWAYCVGEKGRQEIYRFTRETENER